MAQLLGQIILGVVQGITEWLPISSSGHLAILQHFFKIKEPLFFNIMLHFVSLLVIIIVFRKQIVSVLDLRIKQSREYLLFLVIASIPAVIFGFLFYGAIRDFFSNLLFVGFALLFTGFLLYSTRFSKVRKQKVSALDAVLIGLAQAIALLPGISRSGATISFGLLAGDNKRQTAKFSFLLAIPAIVGALIFEFFKIADFSEIEWQGILLGGAVSFVVGLLSINLLLRVLQKGKMHYFSYYCFIAGGLTILLYVLL